MHSGRKQPAYRPDFVTVYVIVVVAMALFALLEGIVVLLASNKPHYGPIFLVIGVILLVSMAGLWRMKDWARIAVIALHVLAILALVVFVSQVARDVSLEAILGFLLMIACLAVPTYWLATHRAEFD